MIHRRIVTIWAMSSLLGMSAWSAQWIVKDPNFAMPLHAASQGIEVKRVLDFDGDRYVIVDVRQDTFSALSGGMDEEEWVSDTLQAKHIMVDARIGLPKYEVASDVMEGPQAAKSAWHVARMKYADLPMKRNGEGVIVAVLDTGVDYTHPALKNRMWVNKGEIPGNKIDDDENGYVDDVYGYDFTSRDSDPKDSQSHGTHCAGIIASEPQDKDNPDSAQGIAPGARIMALRILQRNAIISDAAEAVKYAVDNGAKVLSNSWRVYENWRGFDLSEKKLEIFKSAIRYAEKRGVIFLAAAGNERKNIDTYRYNLFPVGYKGLSNLVGVAASKEDDKPASFTNYGPKGVHLAAPGNKIISTVPFKRWQALSGTSMATPLVAGLLARGMSYYEDSQQALDNLMKYVEKEDIWKKRVTYGLVDPVGYLK